MYLITFKILSSFVFVTKISLFNFFNVIPIKDTGVKSQSLGVEQCVLVALCAACYSGSAMYLTGREST